MGKACPELRQPAAPLDFPRVLRDAGAAAAAARRQGAGDVMMASRLAIVKISDLYAIRLYEADSTCDAHLIGVPPAVEPRNVNCALTALDSHVSDGAKHCWPATAKRVGPLERCVWPGRRRARQRPRQPGEESQRGPGDDGVAVGHRRAPADGLDVAAAAATRVAAQAAVAGHLLDAQVNWWPLCRSTACCCVRRLGSRQ
jgi:hypothetical protein